MPFEKYSHRSIQKCTSWTCSVCETENNCAGEPQRCELCGEPKIGSEEAQVSNVSNYVFAQKFSDHSAGFLLLFLICSQACRASLYFFRSYIQRQALVREKIRSETKARMEQERRRIEVSLISLGWRTNMNKIHTRMELHCTCLVISSHVLFNHSRYLFVYADIQWSWRLTILHQCAARPMHTLTLNGPEWYI